MYIDGFECFYFPQGAPTGCRPFTAAFFDVGPGGRGDFFQWGETGLPLNDYGVAAGNITVDLGH